MQGTPFHGDYATQLGITGVNNLTFPLFDIGQYTLPSGDTFGGARLASPSQGWTTLSRSRKASRWSATATP